MNARHSIAVRRARHAGPAGRTPATVIAALAVAVIVGGCGGGPSASSQVTSTLKTYLADLAHGNGPAACSELTAAATQEVANAATGSSAKTCPRAVEEAAKELKGDEAQTLLDAKVVDVHVDGNSATANLKGGTRAAHLTKADGRWLISGGVS
jgi:hypothetical protein